MARALIVGCGCRGRAVGKGLLADGWAVRGTSRRQDGLAAIEAAGIEPALADPEHPATLLDLIGDVAAVYWLLGSASGAPGNIEAIHGSRLERFLERLVETPVRRFIYEAFGSIDPEVLAGGAVLVERAAETWQIPVEVLRSPDVYRFEVLVGPQHVAGARTTYD